ncbi:MAG TPA: carboxy-S-adenosyl-L-methionine synthase CmoA [Turneriella sp.]|nr:carboxy-S-adenosyl-L-methionine synthase CmoA [Turneriella sp.]
MRDEIFKRPGSGKTPFEFNAQVAEVFDDMVSRSVPFYREVLRMTAELAHDFYQPGTQIYDLGCSTGALLPHIEEQFAGLPYLYTGIDNSDDMILKANLHCPRINSGAMKAEFSVADIAAVNFEPASVFVSNYTFQFLKPLARQALLRRIYTALASDGCLLLSEKCLEDSADVSRLYADHYHAMKARNGYSELEIAEKREALENVLIPFRVSENIEMLREAGFNPVSIFFKCYGFTSFLALKA